MADGSGESSNFASGVQKIRELFKQQQQQPKTMENMEEEPQIESIPPEPEPEEEEQKPQEQTISDRVVGLLNKAQTARESQEKLLSLRQVQELIIHQDPYLLDNFLDEMLAFMNDSSVDVRKFVLGFIEEACKKDAEILPKVVPNVAFMMSSDQNVNVLKRGITAAAHMLPQALQWVAKTKTASGSVQQSWDEFCSLKGRILPLLDSDNEGIRTHTIKFAECCILAQSCKSAQSEGGKADQISLDVVPRDHRFLSFRQLESESKSLVQRLLQMMSSAHISSVNLMTCMGVLNNVARQRPEFLEKVLLAFETLHVNLPPTLAKSQVSSVRKSLKLHLLSLLRHPASSALHAQISTLLTDLGATQQQVMKALPADSELRKRIRKSGAPEEAPPAKKPKDEEEEEEEPKEEKGTQNAIDITAQYLFDKLSPRNVADLVLLTMVVLPDTMPPQFQSSYTPIAAAGTEAQIRHLSRLMATQMTAAGAGPGAELMRQEQEDKARVQLEKEQAKPKLDVPPTPKHTIETLVGGDVGETKAVEKKAGTVEKKVRQSAPVYGVQGSKSSKRLHQFGLAHITRPMEKEAAQKMFVTAFERIMASEKRIVQGGATICQQKILVRLVCRFRSETLEEMLRNYILHDQKSRADLAVHWLYEAFAIFQGFTKGTLADPTESFETYDRIFCKLLQSLFDKGEHKESLFHKLFLEAPQITPNALEILKQACMDPVYGAFGMMTLREMILTRPRQRGELLCAVLDFSCYEKPQLRTQSVQLAKELCTFAWIKGDVKNFVSLTLRHLLEPVPPPVLFGADKGRAENPLKWEEETIKCCLCLFLHLLPLDHSLINELAFVYVGTTSDIKRYILKMLEQPVKAMGMHSPELLLLVDECPEGAETLVTRIVHLLTERNAPTPELVAKVRDLYKNRVSDVRCLIPVLAGLTKEEILAALPKLIRLNAIVVKEVFNRLLSGKSLHSMAPPMNPTDLLVTLHQMDTRSQDELKSVVTAMNHLLSLKSIYTKDVLSSCIQQLIESETLPQLLMRTVLQAFNLYPALQGFIMNVLHRLIARQIWEYPKLWEGFVRVCERSQPHSFPILLQLPPGQLRSVFMITKEAELRRALIKHIDGLNSQQLSHIPAGLLQVLKSESTVDGDENTELIEVNASAEHSTNDTTLTIDNIAD